MSEHTGVDINVAISETNGDTVVLTYKSCKKCGNYDVLTNDGLCHECYIDSIPAKYTECKKCGASTRIMNGTDLLCEPCYIQKITDYCSQCNRLEMIVDEGLCGDCAGIPDLVDDDE